MAQGPEIDILWPMYAPLTFHIGFIDAPPAAVAAEYARWMMEIGVTLKPLAACGQGGIRAAIRSLEPLITPWNRLAIIESNSPWTALLCNAAALPDVTSAVAMLASRLRTRGVYCDSTPSRWKPEKLLQGGLKFAYFDEVDPNDLEPVRLVHLLQEDNRWLFHEQGAQLPCEAGNTYRTRRLAERFSTADIVRCLANIGIQAVEERFFGDKFWTFECIGRPPRPAISFFEARRKLGLEIAR